MRTTLDPRTDARPVESRTCAGPSRARRATRAAQTARRPQRAALQRWAGDFSYRVVTNRYVFYGLLLLAASLIAGAITLEHEELWRTAAALGVATTVIGLVHAWLDKRADRRRRCSPSKGRENEL